MNKKLNWLITNGGLLALLFGTIHFKSNALGRVTILAMWGYAAFEFIVFCLVILAVALDIIHKNIKESQKIKPAFPAWFSVSVDLIVAVICAYLDWKFTAAIWIIQIPLWAITFEIVKSEIAKKSEP